MRTVSALLLFAGTMLAAAGYGATFLLSAYFRAYGGSDVDTGLTLGAAMIGTFAGVPLVGWFSGRIDAAKIAAIAAFAIACGFLTLSVCNADGMNATRVAGLMIGLGWGMFYIAAPLALSERTTDTERGFWFTRFGAFQMAGIGGSPVLLNFAVTRLGFPLQTTFLLVGGMGVVAAALLIAFGRMMPLKVSAVPFRPWFWDITHIASGPAIWPILMVGLGACVFSGMMTFQTSLVEGTGANAGTYFAVYAVTVVAARLLLARLLNQLPQSLTAIGLLCIMSLGIVAMFGTAANWMFQSVSAVLTGIGYGLVYSVIQTWAVNHAQPRYRHAALTWFVLAYFVGIFGFPVIGGWVLVRCGPNGLLTVLLVAATLELGVALLTLQRSNGPQNERGHYARSRATD